MNTFEENDNLETQIPICCDNPNWVCNESYDYISEIKRRLVREGYIISKYTPHLRILRVYKNNTYLGVYVGFEHWKCTNCLTNNLTNFINSILEKLKSDYESELYIANCKIKERLEMEEFNAELLIYNDNYEITSYNGDKFYVYKKLSNSDLDKVGVIESKYFTNKELINNIGKLVNITEKDIIEINQYLINLR